MGAYDLGELGPASVMAGGLSGLLEAYKMKIGRDVEEAKMRQGAFSTNANVMMENRKLEQAKIIADTPPKFIELPDPNNPGMTITVATGPGGKVTSLTRGVSKVDPKASSKENAMKTVSTNLRDMARVYGQLNERGAIVNTEKGGFSNIMSRLSASRVGQAAGVAVGGQSQSLRNDINQMKPLLINSIRQASGMGARGMDSEKELEFYLKAATDPTLDVQTNLRAIDRLDKAYGLGLGISDAGTPLPAAPSAPGPMSTLRAALPQATPPSGGKYAHLTDAQIRAALAGGQ